MAPRHQHAPHPAGAEESATGAVHFDEPGVLMSFVERAAEAQRREGRGEGLLR